MSDPEKKKPDAEQKKNEAEQKQKNEGKKITLDDFLHPKSMLTPGIAGGLTTLITNVLTSQFSLPPNYTGLAVSGLFGLIVCAVLSDIHVVLRGVYFILNSLIIFAVAMGANQAGVGVAETRPPATPPTGVSDASLPAPFFSNWTDGTVKKRAELVSQLTQVDDAEAKETLEALEIDVSHADSPQQTLKWYASSARTAGDVEAIKFALAKAQRAEPPDAAP